MRADIVFVPLNDPLVPVFSSAAELAVLLVKVDTFKLGFAVR